MRVISFFTSVVLLFTFSEAKGSSEKWEELQRSPTITGAEPLKTWEIKSKRKRCFIYSSYIVIEEGKSESVGSDIRVFKREKEALNLETCKKTLKEPSYLFKNKWAEYFYGLYKDLLFIDSGTAPSRGLYIVSLKEKKIRKDINYEAGRGRLFIKENFFFDTAAIFKGEEVKDLKIKPCRWTDYQKKMHKKHGIYQEDFVGTRRVNLKTFKSTAEKVQCLVQYHM